MPCVLLKTIKDDFKPLKQSLNRFLTKPEFDFKKIVAWLRSRYEETNSVIETSYHTLPTHSHSLSTYSLPGDIGLSEQSQRGLHRRDHDQRQYFKRKITTLVTQKLQDMVFVSEL
jgi:hypothetical protein